jgi:DNA polymerase (family X)
VLDTFDMVVASIHGASSATERQLRTISNRHTTIITHMAGCQLERRPGYKIDVEKVLCACAKERRLRRDRR